MVVLSRFFRHSKLLSKSFISIQQAHRQIFPGGQLIVLVRAGDKGMAFVFSLGFDGHLHPPASALGTFPESDLMFPVFEVHDVFDERSRTGRVVVFAVVKTVGEIPDQLGQDLGGLAGSSFLMLKTVKPGRSQFVTHSGITADLASFFGKETAGDWEPPAPALRIVA